MKRLTMLTAVIVLIIMVSSAMAGTIVNSKHDMRTFLTDEGTQQVCVFCHTPHQSASANAQDPLWNKQLSAVNSYGVYNSSTLNANDIADIGGATLGSATTSHLCMSCHDGTVAVNALFKAPLDGNAGTLKAIPSNSSAYLGTSLSDDHPINFTYDAALASADGGLVTPANSSYVTANIPLYNGKVQCASCHNVHDPQNAPFLRVSNSGSGLCLKCHIK